MNIVGKGKKVLDANLLARLAVNQQSGATVSKAEVKSAINSAVQDLKDDFSWRDSSSGLKRSADAVANTLELAVNSGWVRGGSAKELIAAFVDGSGEGDLADVMSDIRAETRENNSVNSGYGGGGSSSVSYSGGSSHYGT